MTDLQNFSKNSRRNSDSSLGELHDTDTLLLYFFFFMKLIFKVHCKERQRKGRKEKENKC